MQLDEWLCIGIPDEVMDEASAWLARLDADHVSLDERQQLSVWLDEDPLHRWAFEELSLLFARVSTLGGVRGQIDAPRVLIFPHAAPPQESVATVTAPSQGSGHQWQHAAALLLIVLGLVFALRGPAETPRGAPPVSAPHTIEHFLPNGE